VTYENRVTDVHLLAIKLLKKKFWDIVLKGESIKTPETRYVKRVMGVLVSDKRVAELLGVFELKKHTNHGKEKLKKITTERQCYQVFRMLAKRGLLSEGQHRWKVFG
jgi:hypothetical protein